jgi:uncharacterized protein (TIGR00251 family)
LFVIPSVNGTRPFSVRNGSLVLRVKAFPGAAQNAIVGVRGGELVIRVRGPAVKGKANKELVKYLSGVLSLSRTEITIVSGQTSRHKVIRLPESALQALEATL